jgi:hypothetical protein
VNLRRRVEKLADRLEGRGRAALRIVLTRIDVYEETGEASASVIEMVVRPWERAMSRDLLARMHPRCTPGAP